VPTAEELANAYRECERITWSQARNFAYGIRLLPPAKRRGLATIYAFARRIDDIGDGDLPAETKLAQLEKARQDLTNLSGDDPVLIALADTAERFPAVPIEAFGELIDGCVADVRGTSYETFDDLHQYCRCVAGSIGRLSLGIFGAEDKQAPVLADSLGVALQLTNILRDIREDYQNGRVYLPAEDLKKFDCPLDGTSNETRAPQAPLPQFGRLIEFEAERAREWYATGLQLLPMLDRRSAACTGAMAGIYRRLLERIAAQPTAQPEGGRRGQGANRGSAAREGQVKAVVIGGGLAGLTAAIELAEQGAQVTLLEAKPRLGGATCSFSRDGLTVDTGQHVFLRCCSAYQGLLAKLGMTANATIQPRFDVTVLSPGSASPRRARLRRTALPGPLHMLPALARYPFLSLAERAVVSRASLAMRRVDPADPAVDSVRFGDWLAARGQTEHARRMLWDLFTVSALNIAGDDASLSLAATVVKTGLLGANDAADIGVPALPLGELHGDAAARLLTKLGAEVKLGTKAAAIQPQAGEFTVRLERATDGKDLKADAVVLAVPPEQAARLIPPDALPPATVSGWSGLGASPIVNVHVIYDRKVMDLPFVAAVNSPVQWIFDRTRISGLATPGHQYLALSESAGDEYADMKVAELRELFVPALAELLPAARDANVAEFFVTREPRATFRQVPGTAALRPAAGTKLPGLVLAGAWTGTGWPDTMESAVRSGLAAAAELRRTRVVAEPIYADSLGVESP
jgi:squalene synthase HpnD